MVPTPKLPVPLLLLLLLLVLLVLLASPPHAPPHTPEAVAHPGASSGKGGRFEAHAEPMEEAGRESVKGRPTGPGEEEESAAVAAAAAAADVVVVDPWSSLPFNTSTAAAAAAFLTAMRPLSSSIKAKVSG